MSMTRGRSLATLLVAASASGCALATFTGDPTGSNQRLDRATVALERGDFGSAERELRWLAARCETGAHGRNALLLLAAAQLDTGNPYASPRTAADLAARYLRLPDARAEDLAVARALYRLAVDLGAEAEDGPGPGSGLDGWEPLADRFVACDAGDSRSVRRPLPEPPSGSTTAARIRALEEEVIDRTDSLAAMEQRLTSLRTRMGDLDAAVERITALEAEIERIRELLRRPPLGTQPDAP